MEDFVQQVDRLRKARRWTQARLISEASSYESEGTSLETIRNAVTGRRGTKPSTVAIRAIARALEVAADTFPAYRIAQARDRLDPAIVGPATALASADVLLSQPVPNPEEIVEEAGPRPEAPPPEAAPSETSRQRKGRAA